MRVFVTGSTGFIGTVVVREVLSLKHQVLGLTRSPSSASALVALGAEAHNGSLADLESLKTGAVQCDGVIHLAFNHDFSDYVGACAKDRAAITTLGEALAGTGKPFINTSAIMMLKSGQMDIEDEKPDMNSMGVWAPLELLQKL